VSAADLKQSGLSTKLKMLEKNIVFQDGKHFQTSLNFCQPQPAAGSKLDSRRRAGYLRLSRSQPAAAV